ncbi:ATP-binding protein [Oscillospiraceae bacterium PP1C4]
MQELSLNVLDVAQNSVRAGATLIEITVDEQPQKDLLIITIADNGCGMSPQQISKVTDPFFTTRTTRKVGLGVPFFKMAAEMTGGHLVIDSKVGAGTTVKAFFGLSHIDRMPLGDISATICSLIQCNPDIDFTYTYRRSEQAFTADTRVFRGILEGVPLSNPEVIEFIGGFIREHSSQLLKQTINGGLQ